MSRIGNKPIAVPCRGASAILRIPLLEIKGPKGSLSVPLITASKSEEERRGWIAVFQSF